MMHDYDVCILHFEEKAIVSRKRLKYNFIEYIII